MGNLFNFSKFNTIFLYGALITFPAVLVSPPAYAIGVGLNKANFALKMQKLTDKILKYKDKGDSNKVISIMLEIKEEIEIYTGKKIDFKKELDKTIKNISKKTKAPKNQIQSFKNLILSKEKSRKHRSLIMFSYLNDNTGLNFKEYELIYKSDDDDDEGIEISAQFAIGGTLILAGALIGILAIEFPVLVYPAEIVAVTGFEMITYEFVDQCNKKDKK